MQDSDYHTMCDELGNEKPQTLPIVIEDDVWIGAKAIILKGVTLGKGCVVAAGSVVTKSAPAYSLIGGNPARIIKQDIKHS
jgi:acetyltransferase-like isoleucine patch superfamily enzyme